MVGPLGGAPPKASGVEAQDLVGADVVARVLDADRHGGRLGLGRAGHRRWEAVSVRSTTVAPPDTGASGLGVGPLGCGQLQDRTRPQQAAVVLQLVVVGPGDLGGRAGIRPTGGQCLGGVGNPPTNTRSCG